MQYFALLISREQDRAPDDLSTAMAAFEAFHAKAGPAIKAGDALAPAAAAVVITGGRDAPVVTDGPFAEAAEVACGYYIFEAETSTRHWHWRATSRSPRSERWGCGRWSTPSSRPAR